MTPTFAAAVDPIFLRVLDLLERIGNNQRLTAIDEFNAIQNAFREAEARIGELNGWELAKYALAAWVDDVLIEAPWDGRDWWENNSLEFAYFKTRDRATEFFLKSKQAADLSRRDILEVFYVCVVLGFRGVYALSDAVFLADQLQLPATIQGWADRTARSIQIGHGRPGIRESLRPLGGAPPLEAKFRCLSTGIVTLMLLAITIVLAYYTLLSMDF